MCPSPRAAVAAWTCSDPRLDPGLAQGTLGCPPEALRSLPALIHGGRAGRIQSWLHFPAKHKDRAERRKGHQSSIHNPLNAPWPRRGPKSHRNSSKCKITIQKLSLGSWGAKEPQQFSARTFQGEQPINQGDKNLELSFSCFLQRAWTDCMENCL